MQVHSNNSDFNEGLENNSWETGDQHMSSAFGLEDIDPTTPTLVVNSQVENQLFNIEDDIDIYVTDVDDEYDAN